MTEPLILTVTPRGGPGIFVGKIEGTGLTVRPTKHPLVDTARALLLVGASPETVLIMRSSGSNVDRVRGSIGAILRKVSRKGRKSGVRQFPERKLGSGGPRASSYSGNPGEDDPR